MAYPYTQTNIKTSAKMRMRIGQSRRFIHLGEMNFPEIIRRILQVPGWNQARLADELKLSQASISRQLSGNQEPKYETGKRIINVARSLAIMEDDPTAPQKTMIAPIKGIVGLGENIEWIGDSEMSLGEVELPFPVKEGCIALEARGDSQYPRVKNGEVLIVYFNGKSASDMIGQEAVVKLEDGTYLMKTIRRGYEDETFNLESFNAPPRENVKILQVAAVVAIIPNGQWSHRG